MTDLILPGLKAGLWGLCALAVGLAGSGGPALAEASSWPTLHRDCQRSGYTDEIVRGPYERKWFRDFHDEMIATRAEAIVAEGKCFVGTFAGNLHALNVSDGKTAWTFKAAGPIGHSPTYHDGKLYVGSEGEAFDSGYVYCLSAADGTARWRARAGAGGGVSPACDGEKVYFGDRAGVFHAVGVKDGKEAWRHATGGMILTPASISADGKRIVFASEDMHVYCMDPAGKLLWRSGKVGGLSLRDHGPTLWKGLAIVRTNPVHDFHGALGMSGMKVLGETQKAIPPGPDDVVIQDKWGTYALKYTEARMAAERKAVAAYLEAHPEERTFWAFDLEDGKEPWMAPVPYTCGLHNTAAPPTFNPKTGDLYLWNGSALSNYSAGVPGGACVVGRLDRETGLVETVWHKNLRDGKEALGWAFDFAAPADETQTLSLMGSILLNTHQGLVGGLDLETLKWHRVYVARDTYGGIFGPVLVGGYDDEGRRKKEAFRRQGFLLDMPNEWHGPDRSIVAIAEGRLFWVVGSQVVCLGGPDVPKTDSGGTKAPPPIKRRVPGVAGGGNLTASGAAPAGQGVEKTAVSPGELEGLVAASRKSPKPSDAPLAARARQRLEATVAELVDEGPWAPLVIELGISHEERHFWRTSETMQAVALALPHLSAPARARAKAYLDGMVETGCPLDAPVHPAKVGKRREPYDLGSGRVRAFAEQDPRYGAGVEDLYALWAYAEYADGWDKVLAQAKRVREVWEASKPFTFDPAGKEGDEAERLNGHIAGALAYARIMRKAGDAAEAGRATARLAELVTERVHHERTDRRLVRALHGSGHTAKVPRYVALVPEVGALLRARAGADLARNVGDLMTDLPVWYQAWGERMIGGENYLSPPHLSRALFTALADGVAAEPAALARFLDQPWCKADLYDIEKTTAVLRRIEGAR